MISVIVLVRNARQLAALCLQSLLLSSDALSRAGGGVEFILADDFSDAERGIIPLFQEFRASTTHPVTIIRYARHQHYTHALAYALSAARGDYVLFISHDMILTPACVEALMDAVRHDDRIGIIRPTSQHMDYARALTVVPPQPLRTVEEVINFSAQVRTDHAGELVDVPMLIGDAMLIRRAVLDRVGVLDTRFFGFMADIDFGLRAARAGFRIVVSRGAWLHHEGNGAGKEIAATGGRSVQEHGSEMVGQAKSAYEKFRRKWGEQNLPPHFREMRREHFERLHALERPAADEYQPPLALSSGIAEVL